MTRTLPLKLWPLWVLGAFVVAATAGVRPAAAQVPPPPTIVRQTPAANTSLALPTAPLPPFSITHYDLKLSFDFPAHRLEATATVALTANTPVANAAFHLNQNLEVGGVTDASGANLGDERQQDQVIVTLPAPLAAGAQTALTFHYAGALADANLSPISGIRTAYVGPEGAFLLYPGEWFPLVGYGTNRFTATVTASLPASLTLLGSGTSTTTPNPDGSVTYRLLQDQPSFPGSLVVTPLKPQSFHQPDLAADFYFSPDVSADLTKQYADAAAQVYSFLGERLGTPPTHTLQIVELPADALPSFSSPDLIVLSRSSIGSAANTSLLTDEIAQQWFGIEVSPASLNDAWLQYGAARFCESLWVEQSQGKAAWQDLVDELEVGALSYPDTALDNSTQLYIFSPQFQDLNYDKGAMLFHMLRWELGDQPLLNGVRQFLTTYAGKAASTGQFEQTLEAATRTDLRSFFSQWYQGTAIPEFDNQYTTYRLQSGGYRVTGKITQNLDLFNMPVQVRVDTDGATENKTVNVAGANSEFSVDVAGRPRRVILDPDNWILKSSPDLKLRVALSRGDNLVAAGDFPGAIRQYQAALQLNPISSLAHYRMAEAYFQEQNWQSAANEYRQAMNGDLNPKWVAVWSHIQIGKIFDLTGQRDRAVNEYQLAVSTHDDTNGAMELAQQYERAPYKAGSTP